MPQKSLQNICQAGIPPRLLQLFALANMKQELEPISDNCCRESIFNFLLNFRYIFKYSGLLASGKKPAIKSNGQTTHLKREKSVMNQANRSLRHGPEG